VAFNATLCPSPAGWNRNVLFLGEQRQLDAGLAKKSLGHINLIGMKVKRTLSFSMG
jgi:hypothetical protein